MEIARARKAELDKDPEFQKRCRKNLSIAMKASWEKRKRKKLEAAKENTG